MDPIPDCTARGGLIDDTTPPIYEAALCAPADLARLEAYFNRLLQFLGPDPQLSARDPDVLRPAERWALVIQRHRAHRRDHEFRRMDPARMTPTARALLRQMLQDRGRLDEVLARFPNLRGLERR